MTVFSDACMWLAVLRHKNPRCVHRGLNRGDVWDRLQTKPPDFDYFGADGEPGLGFSDFEGLIHLILRIVTLPSSTGKG